MDRLRVFACEAQPIVLEGLARVLAETGDLEYAGSAASPAEALEFVRSDRPDLLLVDHTPGLKGVFQFISDVRSVCPTCQPILWANELAEVDCFRALQIGARGILKKTLPVASVLECLRSVGRGNVWIESALSENLTGSPERRLASRLTPREKEIVHHVCGGLKNKEIAEALTITPGTVKVHLMHIFEKTGVKDRFELAVHGRRMFGVDHGAKIPVAAAGEEADKVDIEATA